MYYQLISKKDVVEYAYNVEVFMMPCELDPEKFPDARKYINSAACTDRVQVNQMARDFTQFACLNQNTGLHPVFYAEIEHGRERPETPDVVTQPNKPALKPSR